MEYVNNVKQHMKILLAIAQKRHREVVMKKKGVYMMMNKIRVLNLYAGLGGNRELWPSDKIEVKAIEIDRKIAIKYQDAFPNDRVIVADAHRYLLEHYKEFDFIWSSPPCQSHSECNNFLNAQGVIRYPDMSLYAEIIFLKHFAKCKWVVENVIGYYEPLVAPQVVGRHYLWSNFIIPNIKSNIEIGTFNRQE